MCGIAGYSGNFRPHVLNAMALAIAHRGPDSDGFFTAPEDGIGLAHRRLSIIDLSADANQPMRDESGDVVIVFNGEIYNYRELREGLLKSGCNFRTQSDTEVLLRLYLREGIAMLSRLNGMFAFAIWDNRSKELLLARDALGVKPLYFAETGRGLAFASEIKGILPALDEPAALDPATLDRYLTFLWCPGEGVMLKGVKKLPPGEALMVKEGRVCRRWQWYQLPIFRPTGRQPSLKEAISGTADLLGQAVRRQLVADVPVGAFLSGGLDSSSIVAMAREQVPDLRCFTIHAKGDEEPGNAEDLPYARLAAKHMRVSLDVIEVDSARIAGDLARMASVSDEPLADPASLNVFYISQEARRQGIKVLLSGVGGDDLFTGYRRHRALNYEWAWSWLPVELSRRFGKQVGKFDQSLPIYRRLSKLLSLAEKSGAARLAGYFEWWGTNELNSLYTSDFRASLAIDAAADPMIRFISTLPSTASAIDKMLALEQRFFLADHNLLYTDKMSMAAGVEVRVPFLDLELVDFAGTIPNFFKQRGVEGKWILKKAMESYLPKEIINRSKSGFGVPLRLWMRNELRELLRDTLSIDRLKMRGIFNPQAVLRLIDQNERGCVDGSYILFSILAIELWCQAFLDQNTRNEFG